MTADVKQVGGTHYSKAPVGLQHWDLMEEYDVAYLEAVASKYLMRWRDKGGVEDLKKSISYLEKMDGRGTRRRVPLVALWKMYEANQVPEKERSIITMILGLGLGLPSDIQEAISRIGMMIEVEMNL